MPGTPETEALLRALVDLMEEKGLAELELEVPDFEVCLVRDLSAMAPRAAVAGPAAAGEAPRAAAAHESATIAVTAPLLGAVHFIPGDGIGPGVAVAQGQVLLVIEAMKVPHEVAAPQDGTVTGVVVREGEMVEYGQPLVWLRPRDATADAE